MRCGVTQTGEKKPKPRKGTETFILHCIRLAKLRKKLKPRKGTFTQRPLYVSMYCQRKEVFCTVCLILSIVFYL